MKRTAVYLWLLALGLVACTSSAGNTEIEIPVEATQALPTIALPVQSPDPTPHSTQAIVPERLEIAPPYEVIKQAIIKKVRRDVNPEGPEVNDDGIVDPQIRQDLQDYQLYLRGMRVIDWQGWLSNLGTLNTADNRPYYDVFVFMEAPEVRTARYSDVGIMDVPREQVEKLGLLQDPSQKNSPPQRVIFSGTIQGMDSIGKVIINNATIEPVE